MSEAAPATYETVPSAAITEAMAGWLSAEVLNSLYNQNAVLNNPDDFLKNSEAKTQAHFNRLEEWTNLFDSYPTDTEIISRQLFAVQMGLSGAFRLRCFVRSNNPKQYMYERGSRPLSINISDEVEAHLKDRFGFAPTSEDLITQTVDADQLIRDTRAVNALRLHVCQEVHEDSKLWQDAGRPRVLRRLGYIARLSDLQKEWLKLGTDYVLHAAYINSDGLQGVAFLEPKTTTDAGLYKPFQLPEAA